MDNGNMNGQYGGYDGQPEIETLPPQYNSGPSYGQENYGSNQPYQNEPYREEPVSLGEWMIAMLIMCIPCVNIIMMFVWAFSGNEKKSKSNYFKASLIWSAIGLVIGIIVYASLIGAMLSSY